MKQGCPSTGSKLPEPNVVPAYRQPPQLAQALIERLAPERICPKRGIRGIDVAGLEAKLKQPHNAADEPDRDAKRRHWNEVSTRPQCSESFPGLPRRDSPSGP